MSETIVGIDLGTTNSLIGWMADDGPRLVEDQRGSPLVPSVVALMDGRVVVGRAARNQLLLEPGNTIARCKRLMGTDARLALGDRTVTPTEVSAFILSELLDRAEAVLGTRPSRAVITVPAFFKDTQRQATKDAGEIAGLAVERLVNEPTAAALNHETGGESRVLVYDFGGGTFDVSVLDRDEGFLEVRSSHGDTELGGSDIDAALVEHVLTSLGRRRALVELDPRAMSRLADSLERAKIALSSAHTVQLAEPFLAGNGADIVNLDRELERADVERLLEPFVDRTLECIDRALSDAGVDPSSLDRVILVGGSSKIPYVARRVSEHLNMPAQVDGEADLAVALGVQRLAGRAQGLAIDDVLVDVTPHTLSAGVLDGARADLVAAGIIERNTVVPCERKETYYTHSDDQRAVRVPVLQGERRLAGDNTELGELVVEDLPDGPAGSPIDVTFRLDLSGVLHATAIHVPSGLEAQIRIADSPTRLTNKQRKSARTSLEALRQGRPAPEQARSSAEATLARALLERARTVLGKKRNECAPKALAAVEAAIQGVEYALEHEQTDVGQRAEALSDALLDLT
jgi:molecular chaperone DnaK